MAGQSAPGAPVARAARTQTPAAPGGAPAVVGALPCLSGAQWPRATVSAPGIGAIGKPWLAPSATASGPHTAATPRRGGSPGQRGMSGPAAKSAAARNQLALQRLGDQGAGVVDTKQLDEATEAWALRLSEQHLVKGREPRPQRLEAVRLADFIDQILQILGAGCRRHRCQGGSQRLQCRPLCAGCETVALLWPDKIPIVGECIADELVQHGKFFGAGGGRILADEAPQRRLVLGIGDGDEIEQQRKTDWQFGARWLAKVDVPGGIVQLQPRLL